MAARATPHQSTGIPPFTMMTGETWRYHYTCCTNLVTWTSSPPTTLTSTWKSYISTWEQLSPSRNSSYNEVRKAESLLRPKGLSPWAQCRRSSVVLQFRPTKAECSPSPVKEVPTSLDGTPWDCRQALTCCLSNQNQTRAQRASPSMGPSKPDKEAPGLQPTWKGGKIRPTDTDRYAPHAPYAPHKH